MTKLEIQRARNALSLATSDIHEYTDLHLYATDARLSLDAYLAGVAQLGTLTERLNELEAA